MTTLEQIYESMLLNEGVDSGGYDNVIITEQILFDVDHVFVSLATNDQQIPEEIYRADVDIARSTHAALSCNLRGTDNGVMTVESVDDSLVVNIISNEHIVDTFKTKLFRVNTIDKELLITKLELT